MLLPYACWFGFPINCQLSLNILSIFFYKEKQSLQRSVMWPQYFLHLYSYSFHFVVRPALNLAVPISYLKKVWPKLSYFFVCAEVWGLKTAEVIHSWQTFCVLVLVLNIGTLRQGRQWNRSLLISPLKVIVKEAAELVISWWINGFKPNSAATFVVSRPWLLVVSIHSLHLYNSSTGVLKNESDVFKGSNGNSGNLSLSWFCRFLIVSSVDEKSRNHYQKDCRPFRISLVQIRSVESLVTFYSPQGLTRIIVKNQDH